VTDPAPSTNEPAASDRDAAAEVVAAVRQRTARAMFRFIVLGGIPAALMIAWVGLVLRRPEPAIAIGVTLIGMVALLLWRASRRASPRIMALVVILMVGVPISSMLGLGPGIGSGVGLVVVGVLVAIFFGARASFLAWLAAMAILTVIWFRLDQGDRIGAPDGWIAPRWLYLNGMLAFAAWMGIAMSAVGAVIHGLAEATAELRRSLDRERAERDGRIASERALLATARLDAIGRLAAGVVHDTRNAMTVLKSGLAEFGERPLGDDDRELVSDMSSAVAAAEETMRQLLSLGAQPGAPPREVDVSRQLARFSRAVSRLLPVTVAVTVDPLEPGVARVSPGLLDQALLNLCLNARDAMPDGGILRLGVRAFVDGGRPVLGVEVEDRGPGLAPEVIARLFQPFATSKGDQGTGLGLAMVQGFAHRAGGRIEVLSDPGRGTCFRLILPRVAEVEKGAAASV